MKNSEFEINVIDVRHQENEMLISLKRFHLYINLNGANYGNMKLIGNILIS